MQTFLVSDLQVKVTINLAGRFLSAASSAGIQLGCGVDISDYHAWAGLADRLVLLKLLPTVAATLALFFTMRHVPPRPPT